MNREDFIEVEVAEYEAKNGPLPVHNKGVLRSMIGRDHDFWERADRDYVYGQDEGEAPMGAEW